MSPLLIAAVALLAIGAAAGGGGGGSRRRRRTPVSEGCPPGWFEDEDGGCLSMDECNPLDESTWLPGYMCVMGDQGHFVLVPTDDPAAIGGLNFYTLGDESGVRSGLNLLGHTSPDMRVALADFQNHLGDIYNLGPADIRKDGRLDQNTIDWLMVALTDLQAGKWYSPQEWIAVQQEAFEEELEATPENWVDTVSVNERPNAEMIVSMWGPDPASGGWPLARNDMTVYSFADSTSDTWDEEAGDGQLFSSWLTNVIYWGTYADFEGSPAPRSFYPVPYTERWEQEKPFREAWQRINGYVLELMNQIGATDGPFTFGE